MEEIPLERQASCAGSGKTCRKERRGERPCLTPVILEVNCREKKAEALEAGKRKRLEMAFVSWQGGS